MNAVCMANTTSTSQTPPRPVAAATNSSSDVAAMPATVTSSSVRRSTASAIAPPHNPNTTSGTSPNRPVSPTHADEPVSWKIWNGTATTVSCDPIVVTIAASHRRR